MTRYRPRYCERCLKADLESNITTHVAVQLISDGPLHLWRRSDWASIYMGRHTTLCGFRVVPKR